jgi:riboflavin synthase
MFTGIVEELGTVVAVGAGRLTVSSHTVSTGLEPGASVSVNGVCLTLVARDDERCSFDLSEETLERTTLGSLEPGNPVNLERPVTLASRLGGHLVQGHVDGVGEVAAVAEDAQGARMRITAPENTSRFIVEQGSIAVDGVSLTVAALDENGVEVALVPHTLAVTTLGSLRPGDRVNLEVDMIAKHVERLMEGSRR